MTSDVAPRLNSTSIFDLIHFLSISISVYVFNLFLLFLPARTRATGTSCGTVFVCRMSVFYRSVYTDGNDFWHRCFSSTYPTLFYKYIRVSPKQGSPLLKYVQFSGLRKFRHGKSIVLSTKLVNGRACWTHSRRLTRRQCNAPSVDIIIIIYLLKSTEQEDAHMINTRTRAGQERHRILALTFCP